jgi:hypothetical protein
MTKEYGYFHHSRVPRSRAMGNCLEFRIWCFEIAGTWLVSGSMRQYLLQNPGELDPVIGLYNGALEAVLLVFADNRIT